VLIGCIEDYSCNYLRGSLLKLRRRVAEGEGRSLITPGRDVHMD